MARDMSRMGGCVCGASKSQYTMPVPPAVSFDSLHEVRGQALRAVEEGRVLGHLVRRDVAVGRPTTGHGPGAVVGVALHREAADDVA